MYRSGLVSDSNPGTGTWYEPRDPKRAKDYASLEIGPATFAMPTLKEGARGRHRGDARHQAGRPRARRHRRCRPRSEQDARLAPAGGHGPRRHPRRAGQGGGLSASGAGACNSTGCHCIDEGVDVVDAINSHATEGDDWYRQNEMLVPTKYEHTYCTEAYSTYRPTWPQHICLPASLFGSQVPTTRMGLPLRLQQSAQGRFCGTQFQRNERCERTFVRPR